MYFYEDVFFSSFLTILINRKMVYLYFEFFSCWFFCLWHQRSCQFFEILFWQLNGVKTRLKVCLGLFSKCTGTLLDQDEDRSCKEDHSNKEEHAGSYFYFPLKFRLSDYEEFLYCWRNVFRLDIVNSIKKFPCYYQDVV